MPSGSPAPGPGLRLPPAPAFGPRPAVSVGLCAGASVRVPCGRGRREPQGRGEGGLRADPAKAVNGDGRRRLPQGRDTREASERALWLARRPDWAAGGVATRGGWRGRPARRPGVAMRGGWRGRPARRPGVAMRGGWRGRPTRRPGWPCEVAAGSACGTAGGGPSETADGFGVRGGRRGHQPRAWAIGGGAGGWCGALGADVGGFGGSGPLGESSAPGLRRLDGASGAL